MNYPIRYCGRMFETTAVTVESAAVVFDIPDNAFLFAGARGIIPINIKQSIPGGTTTTLPVLMRSNNKTQGVSVDGDDALTVAGVKTGVRLFYFDKAGDILQLIA